MSSLQVHIEREIRAREAAKAEEVEGSEHDDH